MRTSSFRYLPRTARPRRSWLGTMVNYVGAAAMAMLRERLFGVVRPQPGKQLLSAMTAAAVANVVDRQLVRRRPAGAAARRAPALLVAGSAIALGVAALAIVARRQTRRR